MVRRVGIVLRLEAECAAGAVWMAALASITRQLVAGVELDTGLGRVYLQRPSAGRIDNARTSMQRARIVRGARTRAVSVQHEIVIVAACHAELRIVAVDTRANCDRSPEVERRAGNRRDLTGRNHGRVHGCVGVRIDRDFVAQNVVAAFAA